MKRASKILSLLLAAVLTVALLPAAAAAAPPKYADDGTHKHNWKFVSDTATCTKAGKRTWKCTLCGQKYSEGSPAKGHDWDEGVITTEPDGFTPGVKTYTCKRDSSHTYTEEVDPAPWLFAAIEGLTYTPGTDISLMDLPPIVITEDPQGGAITRYTDETHTMHVTAEGGVGEFSYEWHSVAQDYGKEEDINAAVKWLYGLLGVDPELIDEILNASFSDTDTCTVDTGGQEYYCIVHDEAGQSARSAGAPVRYKMRIIRQPSDVNLQAESPSLYCTAADGSGNYTYTWYDTETGIIGEGQSLPASGDVTYCYCIVTDNVTGDTETSDICEVYSCPPLTLVSITGNKEIWPGEYCPLEASFTGGTPDYEIWWDWDGTAIDSNDTVVGDHGSSLAFASTFGTYTFHVVDGRRESVTGTCRISKRDLTIKRQPVGGSLPEKGASLPISVEMADGKAPFTYRLYYNWEQKASSTADSYSETFQAWEPGYYYIVISDAQGCTATSDIVYVEDPVFRITNQTADAEITKLGEDAILSVDTAGGELPLTFTWFVYKGGRNFEVNSYQPLGGKGTLPVDEPGTYSCKIKDKAGQELTSKYMNVWYRGDRPYIIEQPSSCYDAVPDPKVEGRINGATLSCLAISGSGDDRNLEYDWYYGDGVLYNANSRTIEAHAAGVYRCKVSDRATGAHTYSESVVVTTKLGGLDAEMTAQFAQGWGFYEVRFEGGEPIYTINVYAVTESSGRTLADTKRTRGNYMRFPLPLWQNGEKITYYFEVTDNYGKIIESGPVYW